MAPTDAADRGHADTVTLLKVRAILLLLLLLLLLVLLRLTSFGLKALTKDEAIASLTAEIEANKALSVEQGYDREQVKKRYRL